MKLQMQSVHFDADVKLTAFIQKKADKLETFYDRIIDGEVIMRLQPGEHRENKLIEIKINIPGEQLFAEKQSGTFEAATDEAVDALRRQLLKFKNKHTVH